MIQFLPTAGCDSRVSGSLLHASNRPEAPTSSGSAVLSRAAATFPGEPAAHLLSTEGR